jgi:hypothetical protein
MNENDDEWLCFDDVESLKGNGDDQHCEYDCDVVEFGRSTDSEMKKISDWFRVTIQLQQKLHWMKTLAGQKWLKSSVSNVSIVVSKCSG